MIYPLPHLFDSTCPQPFLPLTSEDSTPIDNIH
jgi:hypothetical protein